MAARRLVFLGAPGSGKGTQARRMAERCDLVALSSGDTLRAEIRMGSQVGRAAQEYVAAGTLVPDDLITRVMLAGIDRLAADAGFILDGYPRTLPQAQALEEGLAQRGRPIQAVVDFRLDDGAIVARLINRRVCTDCGATYNITTAPPRTAGVCDHCGGKVEQRVDDREDVIRTRLETYRRQTRPLIDFYAQRGLLRAVDASLPPEQVEEQVWRVVAGAGGGG